MLAILLMFGCAEFTPHLSAFWDDKPSVVICEGNDINEDDVVESLEWWTDVSAEYEIDYVGWADCQGTKPADGEIWFVEAHQEELDELEERWNVDEGLSVAAFTSMKMTEDEPRQVSSSIVHIKPTNSIDTISHEAGHAFGWSHTTRDDGYEYGHRMSPNESSAQSDFGLEHYRDLTYYTER